MSLDIIHKNLFAEFDLSEFWDHIIFFKSNFVVELGFKKILPWIQEYYFSLVKLCNTRPSMPSDNKMV